MNKHMMVLIGAFAGLVLGMGSATARDSQTAASQMKLSGSPTSDQESEGLEWRWLCWYEEDELITCKWIKYTTRIKM